MPTYPFEDEPYSYVVAARFAPSMPASPRVLRQPVIDKAGVTLRLCTDTGLAERRLPRRDKAGYKAAKAIDWGDTFALPSKPDQEQGS